MPKSRVDEILESLSPEELDELAEKLAIQATKARTERAEKMKPKDEKPLGWFLKD